jgi:hypothetical protein
MALKYTLSSRGSFLFLSTSCAGTASHCVFLCPALFLGVLQNVNGLNRQSMALDHTLPRTMAMPERNGDMVTNEPPPDVSIC